jgi:hypothetical protein
MTTITQNFKRRFLTRQVLGPDVIANPHLGKVLPD